MSFEGKKILVCGMARSGVAAAKCLHDCGAIVTINDNTTEEALAEALKPLEGLNIAKALGGAKVDMTALTCW